MKWSHSLDQRYSCDQNTLIVSGCSFTASVEHLTTAASWPGYVMDRCRFDQCIDYSYAGAGNDYIGDSILYHFKDINNEDSSKYFVIIMWSGIDRVEVQVPNSDKQPNLGGTYYRRVQHNEMTATLEVKQAIRSYNKMIEIYQYLSNRNIKFVFTSYSNVLFPPYIPKRDTTTEFDRWLTSSQLSALRNIKWVPTSNLEFPFEYSWDHDYLLDSNDGFHPTWESHLSWTDNILLPGMQKQNLITTL